MVQERSARSSAVVSKISEAVANPSNPRSLSSRARARRWEELLAAFPDLAEMSVLDLGGTGQFWQQAAVKPSRLVLVNLAAPDHRAAQIEGGEYVQGDACEYRDSTRFDLVLSNSLIEHVGGISERRKLADVVHQHADNHWIQTPYRYFPIEPHWLFPGFQFLPLNLRATITQKWAVGHIKAADRTAAITEVLNVELLSATEMRVLFPASEIWFERVGGLPKSIVAIRQG